MDASTCARASACNGITRATPRAFTMRALVRGLTITALAVALSACGWLDDDDAPVDPAAGGGGTTTPGGGTGTGGTGSGGATTTSAPTITTQPAAASATVGQTATFGVVAAGSAPLTYQWQLNGTNIADATSATYSTPVLTAADSGATYSVVVGNAAGSVTSASVVLTVTGGGGPAPARANRLSATNANHTLARAADGRLWGWGDGSNCQLGDASVNFGRDGPVLLGGVGTASAVFAGFTTSMWLRGDGTVAGFGRDDNGELGTGTRMTTSPYVRCTPVAVTVLSPIAWLSSQTTSSLAIGPGGQAYVWGVDPAGYAAGQGVARPASMVPLPAPLTTVDVASSLYYMLLLASDGTVWFAGDDVYGQAGRGSATGFTRAPVLVQGLDQIVSVQAGLFHGVALRADGTVWTWGSGNWGALGYGYDFDVSRPTQVPGIAGATAVAAGGSSTFALMADGTAFGWGRLQQGSVVGGISQPQVVALDQIAEIAVGLEHVMFARRDGSVWGMGSNDKGQLGNSGGGWTPAQMQGINLN